MQLKVIYFASIREILGVSEEYIRIATQDRANRHDVAALLEVLIAKYPVLADTQALRFAVNHVMADTQAKLSDGDEVALFPPVTGG